MATEDRRTRAEKMRRLLEAQLAAASTAKPEPALPSKPRPGTLQAEPPTLSERVRAGLTVLLVLLLGLATACGSDSGDPNPNPQNPNPPGTLSVTSVAPTNLWLGERFTVYGTGFGTDANAPQLRFPTCEPAGCTIYIPEVISVTPTEMLVELPHVPGTAIIKRGRLRIFLDGDTASAPQMMEFGIPPSIDFEENYNYHFDPPVMRAGDSLSFIVQGWVQDHAVLTVDGGVVEIKPGVEVLEPLTGTVRIYTVFARRALGVGPVINQQSQQNVPVQIEVNGRTHMEMVRAFRVPSFEVLSSAPATIDLSNGDLVTITGTNMPGQIEVRWVSLPGGATTYTSTANGCATICDVVTAPAPAGIVPGNYQIVADLTLFEDETIVGLGNVTVVP